MQRKRVLVLMACLALLMTGISATVTRATDPYQAGDVTFKTPEDAVTAYMQGVAQGDVNKILQACAVDEMSRNFKFDLYIDRLRAFSPVLAPAPSDYPLYVDLNKAQMTAQISSQVKILSFSLLSTEQVDTGITIMMDIDGARNFIKAVDPKKLSQLDVKKIATPNKTVMSSTKYQDNATKLAKVYGADESTERVALFSFEQNFYYVGFTILRYGQNWKISSQTSPLSGISSTGAPAKTTEQDFESMING